MEEPNLLMMFIIQIMKEFLVYFKIYRYVKDRVCIIIYITNDLTLLQLIDLLAETAPFFKVVWPSSSGFIMVSLPPEMIMHIASFITKHTCSIRQLEYMQQNASNIVSDDPKIY